MNFAKYTTISRLFLVVRFGLLSVVWVGSVAGGDLLLAPNRGLPILDDGLSFLRNGGCFVPGTAVRLSAEPSMVMGGATAEQTTTTASATPQITTAAIENVALGARVPDHNPRPEDYDFSFGDVDQSKWRKVDIHLRRKDGALIEMQLLRPAEWIENMGLVAGVEFTPRLSDIEVDGHATVTAISSCPRISEGEGSVVIGRFVTRQVNNLVEVTLESGTRFTGTTTHPVWIPDDQQWVKLGDLEEGQQLESLTGPLTVVAISRLADVSDVFNIEVHGHHVYRITEDGVLVHNNCLEEALAALRKGTDFKWVDNGAEMLVRRTGDTVEAFQPIYTKSDDFGRMIFGLEDIARELGAKTIVVKNVGLGFGPTAGNAAKTRAILERFGGVFTHVGDDILGPLYDITFKVQ